MIWNDLHDLACFDGKLAIHSVQPAEKNPMDSGLPDAFVELIEYDPY